MPNTAEQWQQFVAWTLAGQIFDFQNANAKFMEQKSAHTNTNTHRTQINEAKKNAMWAWSEFMLRTVFCSFKRFVFVLLRAFFFFPTFSLSFFLYLHWINWWCFKIWAKSSTNHFFCMHPEKWFWLEWNEHQNMIQLKLFRSACNLKSVLSSCCVNFKSWQFQVNSEFKVELKINRWEPVGDILKTYFSATFLVLKIRFGNDFHFHAQVCFGGFQ